MNVGVLAFQGAVTPHINLLQKVGVKTTRVNNLATLNSCDRLIIPGGESTTMIRLIENNNLWEPLKEFAAMHPCWGTCAGAILLAEQVTNPSQKSLGMMKISAKRNAYGSQLDSFKAEIKIKPINKVINVDFIRAPGLKALDESVTALAMHDNQEVLLRQKNLLASAFHSELGNDTTLHEYFLSM